MFLMWTKCQVLYIFKKVKNICWISVWGTFFSSYLAILASCFKIVLANLELHLPVFFPKYTTEITVYNIKINCCKIQPRLENNRNLPHDVRSPDCRVLTQTYLPNLFSSRFWRAVVSSLEFVKHRRHKKGILNTFLQLFNYNYNVLPKTNNTALFFDLDISFSQDKLNNCEITILSLCQFFLFFPVHIPLALTKWHLHFSVDSFLPVFAIMFPISMTSHDNGKIIYTRYSIFINYSKLSLTLTKAI